MVTALPIPLQLLHAEQAAGSLVATLRFYSPCPEYDEKLSLSRND